MDAKTHTSEVGEARLAIRARAFDQSANGAVIDHAGTIVDVNHAWHLFTELNGGSEASTGIGTNYLAVCDRAVIAGEQTALEVTAGLRRVLDGEAESFDLTYPCPSPTEQRWFRLHATETPVFGERGAIVIHTDITPDAAQRCLEDGSCTCDRITGLLGIGGLHLRVRELLAIHRTTGQSSQALFVSLHGIGEIGQRYGASATEAIAIEAANRLRSVAGIDDVLGQTGPHELLVLCPQSSQEAAEALAAGIGATLGRPYQVKARAFTITATVEVVETDIELTAETFLARQDRSSLSPTGRADPGPPPPTTGNPPHAESVADSLGPDLARRLAFPGRHRTIIDSLSEGVLVQDTSGTVLFASHQTKSLLEHIDLTRMVPHEGWVLVDALGAPLAVEHRPGRIAMARRQPVRNVVIGIKSAAGIVRWLEVNSQLATDGDLGEPFAIVSSIRDVTQQRLASDRFRMQARLLNSVGQAVAAWDTEGTITFMNEAAEELYGWSRSSALGENVLDIVPRSTSAKVADLRAAMASNEAWEGELTVRTRPRSPRTIWFTMAPVLEGNEVIGHITVASDVTERNAAQALIAHQASHDLLTDLPNRRALLEAIDDALTDDDRDQARLSLLLLNLGPLEVVNDAFGHATGDATVQLCTEVLAGAVHAGDLLARFSDHTFGVLCHHTDDPDRARRYGESLRAQLDRSFHVLGADIHLRPSVGVAAASAGMDAAELLRHVDTALLQARHDNGTQVYDAETDARLRREMVVEAIVDRVVASGQVGLGYQPFVSPEDGRTVGAEALLRITASDGTPVDALEAIEAAERSGSIVPLGELVLRTACRDAAGWRRDHPEGEFHISVNLSPRQLDDPEITARIDAAVADAGLDPTELALEVTESTLMRDPERSIALLTDLKARGIILAADDFGTGYSSLSQLKRYPLDVVKLDQSFVAGLPDDPEDLAITRAVMAMADALGLRVVAEGVERMEQLEVLRELGVHCGQGWLWSKAIDAEAFAARLDAERS